MPDINITSEDGQQLDSSSAYATCDNSSRDRLAQDDNSASAASPMEHETETSTTTGTLCRSSVPTANPGPLGNGGASTSACAKKKLLRLRKMGSRQNSKTESDSSDADTHSVLETPRRLRRKNFRMKQRSLDDDFRLGSAPAANEPEVVAPREEIVYGSLKVRPGPLLPFQLRFLLLFPRRLRRHLRLLLLRLQLLPPQRWAPLFLLRCRSPTAEPTTPMPMSL